MKCFVVGDKKIAFYQVYKFLYKGIYAKELNNDMRMIYSYFCSLQRLSAANGWYNDKKELFVKVKQSRIATELCISLSTVALLLLLIFETNKIMDELKRRLHV